MVKIPFLLKKSWILQGKGIIVQNFSYFSCHRAKFSVERNISVRYTIKDGFAILKCGKLQIRTYYERREND